MSATTRLTSRTLSAAVIGLAVVGFAAGVSASAAPAGPPRPPGPPGPPAASCHIDWFTHPWAPGQFGGNLSIDTTRVVPNWLLTIGFAGSEQVDSVQAGPVEWWHQVGRVVAIKGDAQLRNLPAGQDVLQLPLIIDGTPSGTPWFALNGRPCTVTATTAITPTTTTTTTTTTSRTTSSTSPPDSGGCSASYRVLWQTATQFRASVSWSGSTSLYAGSTLQVLFSGDQHVTEVTPSGAPDATWSQSGATLTVSGYPYAQGQAAVFTATYSGVNGAPLSVGAGFGCRVTFYPAPTTTTTYVTGR